MAQWKKILVSGSNIHVNQISGSTLVLDNLSSNNSEFTPLVIDTNGNVGYGLDYVSATNTTVLTISDNTTTDTLLSTDTLLFTASLTPAATFEVTDNTLTLIIADASSTTKGLASFSTNDFSVNGGVVTIKNDGVTLGTQTTGDYIQNLGVLTGLTTTNNSGEGATPTLSVTYGSTQNTSVEGNTQILFQGTSNEIEITNGSTITLGSGGTVTVGLPNDVTISNNLSVGNNVNIDGDLTVNGTTTVFNTSNLLVEDVFIGLASGSVGNTDGGIIIHSNTNGDGNAFGYDSSINRWSVQSVLNTTASSITPDAYVTMTEQNTSSPSTNPVYGDTVGYGTIHVNTSNGEIWIYS